jgi:hypothetical protein
MIDLAKLVVVPLKDTPHELLHDQFVNYKFKDNRGLSQSVVKEYSDIKTSIIYEFDEIYMGAISSSTGWNLMCNLKVIANGQSYFCFDKCKIPFNGTLFTTPFPNSAIIWGKKPYVLVEMNRPGEVIIQFDRVYSNNELGNEIMTIPKHVIHIEDEKVIIEYGTLTKFEG